MTEGTKIIILDDEGGQTIIDDGDGE